MGIVKEFREFALKGSVVDLAIGLIIGAAFGAVVNSVVQDVLMPPLGYLIGGADFSDLRLVLAEEGIHPVTGNPMPETAISYGRFINVLIAFLIQALAIFLVIKVVNRARRQQATELAEAPPPPPPASNEAVLLAEIRDLLKQHPPQA